MMDHWSSLNDPMTHEGYGFLPALLAVVVLGGAGVAAGSAYQVSQEVTDLDEMRAMVRAELAKSGNALSAPNGDIIRTSFLNGPASRREAWIQAAFWLGRTARIARGKGREMEAETLDRAALRFLESSSTVQENKSRTNMVYPLNQAQGMVFPISYTVANTLERLSGKEAVAMRQSYRNAYDFQEMLTRPAVQTVVDVGEAAAAPFDAIVWLKENAKWIAAGVVGLVIVNGLVSARVASRAARKSAAPAGGRPQRTRYAS
jgi:hypothetical protein